MSGLQISSRLCENTLAARQGATLLRGAQAERLEDSKLHRLTQRRCSLSLRSGVERNGFAVGGGGIA